LEYVVIIVFFTATMVRRVRHNVTLYWVIKKSLSNWRLQYSTIDDLKMVITEYIRNVNRAILNTVRHVNKHLQTGGGLFEHYL